MHSLKRIALLALLIPIAGCGGYEDMSPRAYEYATSLYTICNRQMTEKLDEVAEQIAADVESGELSAREAGWLTTIIADAKSGDWKSGMEAAREMMDSQVER